MLLLLSAVDYRPLHGRWRANWRDFHPLVVNIRKYAAHRAFVADVRGNGDKVNEVEGSK